MDSQNNLAQTSSPVSQIFGWSWGGFLLTWIYGLGFGRWYHILILPIIYFLYIFSNIFSGSIIIACLVISIAYLAYAVYCGNRGGKWAMEKKRYTSADQYLSEQKRWTKNGLVIDIVLIVSIVAYAFAIMNFFSYAETGRGCGFRCILGID